MTGPRDELKAALDVVRQSLKQKQPLNRFHARAVLLPLGQCLRQAPAGGRDQDRDEVRDVAEAVRPQRETWDDAVAEEMEMAVTEIVHGADPRFLGRRDFDWRYADEARARVDDRLRALKALGLELEPALARHLADTDQRLAAARARHTLGR